MIERVVSEVKISIENEVEISIFSNVEICDLPLNYLVVGETNDIA